MTKQVVIYTDGGSRGNPGPAAAGILIFDKKEKLIKLNAKYLGIMTNNQAEYEALLTSLRMAQAMKVEEISFYMDSDLIVKQLRGEFKVKSPNIKSIKATVDKLANKFRKVEFFHVRREYNKFADKLVNVILDAVEKKP